MLQVSSFVVHLNHDNSIAKGIPSPFFNITYKCEVSLKGLVLDQHLVLPAEDVATVGGTALHKDHSNPVC